MSVSLVKFRDSITVTSSNSVFVRVSCRANRGCRCRSSTLCRLLRNTLIRLKRIKNVLGLQEQTASLMHFKRFLLFRRSLLAKDMIVSCTNKLLSGSFNKSVYVEINPVSYQSGAETSCVSSTKKSTYFVILKSQRRYNKITVVLVQKHRSSLFHFNEKNGLYRCEIHLLAILDQR